MEKIVSRFLCILFVLFITNQLRGQIITTVAGNGTAGYGGDGGDAEAAELNWPTGAVKDNAGNIYIADQLNNCIRKVNTSGIISTIAGDTTTGCDGDGVIATSAHLFSPYGVAMDNSGNMYISDFFCNRVRKINSSGVITTLAGNGDIGNTGDGGPATTAALDWPTGMVADDSGNVYIANEGGTIRKVNPLGVISTIAGDGIPDYGGDGGASTAAKLHSPYGVALDHAGNLYIADGGNNRIRKVNTSGIISTFAGTGISGYSGDSGPATAAQLSNMFGGVTVDNVGNVFIPDGGNNRVRMVNTSGVITTIAGNGITGYAGDGMPATDAELNWPTNVLTDNAGGLYIVDYMNNRVRYVINALSVNTAVNNVGSLVIFPNPSENVLNITFGGTITSVVVSNLVGQVVFKNSYNTEKVQIDISNLSAGTYIAKINGSEVRKFLKE